MAEKKTTLKTFQQSLNTLNDLVENMEAGNLTLDESLKQFEKGVKLIRECQTVLQSAEQKIKVLCNNSDELRDFADDNT